MDDAENEWDDDDGHRLETVTIVVMGPNGDDDDSEEVSQAFGPSHFVEGATSFDEITVADISNTVLEYISHEPASGTSSPRLQSFQLYTDSARCGRKVRLPTRSQADWKATQALFRHVNIYVKAPTMIENVNLKEVRASARACDLRLRRSPLARVVIRMISTSNMC